ncbi:hypothetical protein GLOTRDRAFT_130200 [Gloeophyllum trabeum ATCC 11539]|uniref:Uncharacterized protein n=1 Tax=Gloeophyllum trabeum (strain ATCC 11539 / FP-39264 / Madison 617) TaxID=670483 RepID=S7RKD3_GLOTA|nr:uncharacterized protein GLOTRDRAFT_130200 [Gloeophyllum trabeum ATCC 11539]EPQ54850.1 hypothetical protein GLOTRDRAFT_130200 [Gloeophyllum trabeum ATCC 11539]
MGNKQSSAPNPSRRRRTNPPEPAQPSASQNTPQAPNAEGNMNSGDAASFVSTTTTLVPSTSITAQSHAVGAGVMGQPSPSSPSASRDYESSFAALSSSFGFGAAAPVVPRKAPKSDGEQSMKSKT